MNQTLCNAPFLRLLCPLLLGIVFRYYLENIIMWYFAVILIIILLSLYFFVGIDYSGRWLRGAIMALIIFVEAFFLTGQIQMQSQWDCGTEKLVYEVQILEEPVHKPKSLLCYIHIEKVWIDNLSYAINKRALLYLPKNSHSLALFVGNRLSVTAGFEGIDSQILSQNNTEYFLYLKKQGYSATAFVKDAEWAIINHASSSFFPDLKINALECRKNILYSLKEIVPEEKLFSIAAAMLLGYKDSLDKDMKNMFSETGASHVLAVSGLHTGIIYGILNFLFFPLNMGRKRILIKQSVILLFMWFFAFLTGLSPSVVRATVMLSFTSMAFMLGRKGISLNTIAASAFFMLLYNPLYLFDISFQLSYAAVFSIVILNPLLSKLIEFNHVVTKYIGDLISVSISAQLGTLPISVYYFHQFPLMFLVTNLFVIPMSGIILFLTIISLILHFIFPSLFYLFKPLNYVLQFFISGVKLISDIPGTVIVDLELNIFDVMMLYLIIANGGLVLFRRKIVHLYILVLVAVFQLIYYLWARN